MLLNYHHGADISARAKETARIAEKSSDSAKMQLLYKANLNALYNVPLPKITAPINTLANKHTFSRKVPV